MNFIAFPVQATNIFPLANSQAGGQLMSEFNVRSRESVGTTPSVKYFIGPSYTHSMDDYAVYSAKDGQGITISSTAIQIQPGRALVNGHYVELLSPITIDLNDANYLANKENITALKGKLAIGLKMVYSTYQTLAGSAKVENEDGYYDGVQVVILPEGSVKLPEDVPGETQFPQVNMHLHLATFTFRNGTISKVTQNPRKVQYIDVERVANMDEGFSDIYISKSGIDPYKLYVFAGKSEDGTAVSGKDTWCDARDSLMVWDDHPVVSTIGPTDTAKFIRTGENGGGEVVLVVPHKQIDGGMVNREGQTVYYADKQLSLPVADFSTGTSGTVSAEYTNRIKAIRDKVDTFYRLPNGKMRHYIDVLNDRADLPPIPISEDVNWPASRTEYQAALLDLSSTVSRLKEELSKLVESQVDNRYSELLTMISELATRLSSLQLANSDASAGSVTDLQARLTEAETAIRELPTKYVAIGGLADAINTALEPIKTELEGTISDELSEAKGDLETFVKTYLDDHMIFTTWTWHPGDYVLVGQDYTVDSTVEGRAPTTMYVVGPGQVLDIQQFGSELTRSINLTETGGTGTKEYEDAYYSMLQMTPTSLAGGVQLDSYQVNSADEVSKDLWDYTQYKGILNTDYFVARLKTLFPGPDDTVDTVETWTCYYFTPCEVDTRYEYLEPIWLTGGTPLATEDAVGGFVNVPENTYGQGYVRRNDQGYLQLVDYDLLLTGVLAYQLGQDYSEGSGLGLDELQVILDENINDRVAFPNDAQRVSAEAAGVDPNIIHLYLTLPSDSEEGGGGVVTIHDIGSRYGASVYVHILGDATYKTTVKFINCDKLRIDSNIEGSPNIELDRVCLYYDSDVLDQVSSIWGLSLWYERYSQTDPNIQVDGMTVSLVGNVETTDGIEPWSGEYANDNHYSYALRSVTFGSDGSIINIGMLVLDTTTANIVQEGKSAFVSVFTVPQGAGLNYPASKMLHRVKVTGSFVSQYEVADGWMIKTTEFSALSQKYDVLSGTNVTTGTIAFYTDAVIVQDIVGADKSTTVDSWGLDTPHYFIGGVID